jgi:hypothetical protein
MHNPHLRQAGMRARTATTAMASVCEVIAFAFGPMAPASAPSAVARVFAIGL